MLWDEIFFFCSGCCLFAMQFRAIFFFLFPGVNECTKNTQMTADEAWPQSTATRTRRNVIKGSIDMEAIWNYLFEINSSNVRWISWQITAASSAILRRFVCSYLPSLPSFTRHPQIKGLALTAFQKYSYPQRTHLHLLMSFVDFMCVTRWKIKSRFWRFLQIKIRKMWLALVFLLPNQTQHSQNKVF